MKDKSEVIKTFNNSRLIDIVKNYKRQINKQLNCLKLKYIYKYLVSYNNINILYRCKNSQQDILDRRNSISFVISVCFATLLLLFILFLISQVNLFTLLIFLFFDVCLFSLTVSNILSGRANILKCFFNSFTSFPTCLIKFHIKILSQFSSFI